MTVFRSSSPRCAVGTRLAVQAGGEPFGDAVDDELRRAMVRDAQAAIELGESRSCDYADGAIEAFVEAIVPPPRAFVFGTGHDAVPFVQLARAVGWDVVVCSPKPRVTTRERFVIADEVLEGSPAELAARVDACDRAVAVVMSHDYELDRRHLAMLVASRVRYIGVLGPRARTTRMLGELAIGLDEPRIHAPIGLALGAETPHEIALATVAEIQAVLRRAPATSLRDGSGSIHGDDTPQLRAVAG